jgi:hypothetical protein
MTVTLAPRALVGPHPVPAGRGRWRFTLHEREYALSPTGGAAYTWPGINWQDTQYGELSGARGRRLERAQNRAATFTFTVNGRDPIASQVRELQTDVYAWRWDDWAGRDVCVARLIVDHAQDQLTEQSHTVTFGCHDYLAMLERRYLTRSTGTADSVIWHLTQDEIVDNLVGGYGVNAHTFLTGDGSSYYLIPGCYLPLFVVRVTASGLPRTLASPMRDRTYQFGSEVYELIDNLANVINGFDYDVLPQPEVPDGLSGIFPNPGNKDVLRIFYPAQGVIRTNMALVYGGNVATVDRTVSSADYANRIWAIGNKGSAAPDAAQRYSDAYNDSATSTVAGLWMEVLNGPDVSTQAHLDEQAQGELDLKGTLVPSYTLGMRPGQYRYGYPNIGDIVPFQVTSGRLDVQEDLRITGLTYAIGDDGDENIELTVGRPPPTLGRLFRKNQNTMDALTRR